MAAQVFLCSSEQLQDSATAVPFEVVYFGRPEAAFAVRFRGEVHAYLNRCSHVAMEMDYQPNNFYDSTGQWLICATHGATYDPTTGRCLMGPCRGGLIKIDVSEARGEVHWHTSDKFQPALPI